MLRTGVARGLALALTVIAATTETVKADQITVFAAASLKTALDAVADDWVASSGHTAVIAYGGSAALAKQIQAGAPADIFVSAAANWMDTLQSDGLIVAGSRRDLLGNTLVLVAHGHAEPQIDIRQDFDLAKRLGDGKLAMGLVDSVPAGQYGKSSLQSLGIWTSVETNVVQSENVRAAMALVATGEASFGIVYGSDAIADDAAGDDVSVVGTFPADTYPPIVYPAALVADSRVRAAASFLDYLSSDTADAIFAAQGFKVLN